MNGVCTGNELVVSGGYMNRIHLPGVCQRWLRKLTSTQTVVSSVEFAHKSVCSGPEVTRKLKCLTSCRVVAETLP